MSILKASTAEVELHVEAGDRMPGFAARKKPAEGYHDPLCARALLFESGDTRFLIISCDNLHFTPPQAWEVRCRISAKIAIVPENILFCSTHTHSGSITKTEWFSQVVDMVTGMPDKLTPAKIAHASTHVPGIGYNRDLESMPVDDELITIRVEALDGSPIATVINYATHAVFLSPANLLFSGDYPGYICRHINAKGGQGIFLQGACGDIDPAIFLKLGWGKSTFDDCDRTAKQLINRAEEALASAPRTDEVKIDVRSRLVTLPLDPPPSDEKLLEMIRDWELARPKEGEDNFAWRREQEIFLAWAGRIKDAIARESLPSTHKVVITGAAINDLRIIAVPFEPYCDIGLRVKANLGQGNTLFMGYTNGVNGYLASKWAKERGGYGGDISVRYSPNRLMGFGIGAAETLVDAATELGKSLGKNK